MHIKILPLTSYKIIICAMASSTFSGFVHWDSAASLEEGTTVI